ncbi:MAG: DUF4038 domain-containing protein [Chloroflexi bacterium]|nr:DUF4038 domain-containing protein [Chloroflexota bacterium]
MTDYRYLLPPSVVPQFDVIEWFLQAPPGRVPNPFLDAHLSGTIVTPDGREIPLAGFCDSADGSVYRLRFSPTLVGEHGYRLRFQAGEDVVEEEGAFRCVPSARHGVVRVDPAYPYHFLREGGERPFLVSKTAWLLAVANHALTFIDQAAERGFTCVRFALETNAFFSEVGKEVWPWAGVRAVPDFTRFNVRLWQRMEEIIRRAMLRGVLVEPVIFCQMRRESMAPIPDPEMERYWSYLLARLAAFPNILAWELFDEWDGNRPYQAYMARYLRFHDPYDHLICTSFPATGDAAWPEEEWLDIAVNHCSASSDPERHSLDRHYRRIALRVHRYDKPAWCNQSGRERVHGNDDPVHRRKQAWVWNISGNYWSYHSWVGCEGIETLEMGPGEEYYRHMRPFWEEHTRWWTMQPVEDGVLARPPVDFAYLLRSDEEAVIYLVNEYTGTASPAGRLVIAMPPGQYALAFYHPSDGRYRRVPGRLAATSEGLSIDTIAFTDDLVVHVRRVAGGA